MEVPMHSDSFIFAMFSLHNLLNEQQQQQHFDLITIHNP